MYRNTRGSTGSGSGLKRSRDKIDKRDMLSYEFGYCSRLLSRVKGIIVVFIASCMSYQRSSVFYVVINYLLTD